MNIGDSARDTLSGVTGKIVARTEWAWRSAEIAVVRDGCDADGKPWDILWLDEGRVDVVQGEA